MKRLLLSVVALLAASQAPRAQADLAVPALSEPLTQVHLERRVEGLANQVRDAERAFAKTMADRNHGAFASFLSDEAVFMSDGQTLRGKAAVAAGWKRFYDAPQAPFSWDPDRVEVLDSGTLALSSGPVRDRQGQRVGTFNSVWRRDAGGAWKVVFDKGCPPCDCR